MYMLDLQVLSKYCVSYSHQVNPASAGACLGSESGFQTTHLTFSDARRGSQDTGLTRDLRL